MGAFNLGESFGLTYVVMLSEYIRVFFRFGWRLISGRTNLLMFYYIFFFLDLSFTCLFRLLNYFYFRVVFCVISGIMWLTNILIYFSWKVINFTKLLATTNEYLLTHSLITIYRFKNSPFPTWLSIVFSPLQSVEMILTCPSSRK